MRWALLDLLKLTRDTRGSDYEFMACDMAELN